MGLELINRIGYAYTLPMVTLLRKLFIKNYQDISDPKVRTKHGILVSVIGVVINIILVVLKTTSAFLLAYRQNWVFSMALIGDSLNNLGDISSSLVSLIGFTSSNKPADKKHPFGHQRMEYIASLVVAMLIIVAASILLKQSITNLVEQSSVVYDVFAYVVFGTSITLKLIQTYLFFGFGKAIDSTVLKGVGLDSLLDIVSSSVILTGTILSGVLSAPYLDGILGILIACFVGYSGIKIFRESVSLILGERVDKESKDKIEELLLSVPGVIDVHDVLIHDYGASKYFITADIGVDASLSLLEAHEIANQAERKVEKTLHQSICLHMDPRRTDEAALSLQKKAEAVLKGLCPEASLHDFQIKEHSISFDILFPYETKENLDKAKVKKALEEQLDPSYHYHIKIDRPYDQE